MKKILILGGNYVEIEIVTRAKSMGYYTIVTDNHEDWSLSPAKMIADEGWNISWSDIDSLELKCVSENVQGVIAGFSEFRVEAMIKLCSRLNLPCSLTMQQLEVTRDKILFKDTCRKYGVLTVSEYKIGDSINYPVIIKPVDRAGSIGINIAYNDKEFDEYYKYALSLSPSKNVIIEDFLSEGMKFDVYYYIQNGVPYFLGSSDTIMCKGSEGAKILQKCWPFHSKYEREYHQIVESKIIDLFAGLKIDNAYATMSAFYVKGNFYFFEAGFRLSGEMSFNYQEALSGNNYINTMLCYSMKEKTNESYINIENRDTFSVVLNFFVTDGVVFEIKGIEDLSRCKEIKALNIYLEKGMKIHNSTNVFKKGAMVTIVCDSKENLLNTICMVNETFDVLDVNRTSLVYERVTKLELSNYYN